MLTVTEEAQERLRATLDEVRSPSARLRVFVDHRCHCGKAHFSLTLDEATATEDTAFDVGGIPFVADASTVPELPSVEIGYVETLWTTGFTIRNVDHQCGHHGMA